MKIRKLLYTTANKMQKTANILGDIEVLLSGDPKKIYKKTSNRYKNKVVYDTANKISRKITKK